MTDSHSEDATTSLVEMDLADESLIVAELQGHVSDKYVYELKQKDDRGEPVRGLSFAGTNWAAREFAKRGEVIRIMGHKDESTADEPDYYKITVTAQRFQINTETGKEIALDSNIAGKRQWKFMKKNKWENGQKVGEEIVPDPFAWEKCLSKATRNAKQSLMPTEFVKDLISMALKNKAGGARPAAPKTQTAPPRQAQAAPAGGPATAAAPAKPTTQPPKTAAPAPAAGAPAATPKPEPAKKSGWAPKDVDIQKLDAVCKQALGTTDGVAARKRAMEIAGKASPSDLAEEDFKTFGNAFFAVSKKKAKIVGNDIIAESGEALWRGPAPKAPAPASDAPPPPEEPPTEEQMF